MKFLNVAFISESTFFLIQSTCVAAVIKELWEKMKEMWETLQGMQRRKDLVLAGDGRNDSSEHIPNTVSILSWNTIKIYTLVVVDKGSGQGRQVAPLQR